nr:RNA-dependent RNA polymerase [Goose astrovirus]
MNYICTAGHVVRGSDFVTVKSENICVRCKIWKEIEIFESVDTLVLIKLPKELQMVKPLKLAKEIVNDYLTLTTWDANFQNQISFQGWCTIDGNWISNTMNTAFGNSGAPYTNSDGRLVGMHLGTQGVISQGVVVKHILESNIMVQQSQHIDVDELMEKVIAGTKISHAEILKQLDELREKVSIMEGKMKNYDDFWLMQTILGQKKKGKTKKTVRGAKHLYTKKLLSKGHFMKMRMLTDEEYNRMIEEGFSADEIRDAVNHLREQAWLNYCIENDIDEDGVEDWYDEMIADDIANEEIDRKIEEAMPKLEEGPLTPRPLTPELKLGIFDWTFYLLPPQKKISLPDNVNLLGYIPVDKLIVRDKKVKDPLLGIVEKWEQDTYASTTWTRDAYGKIFEKFFYKEPQDFVNNFPELTTLADSVTLIEHSYMENSDVIPIMSTEKNVKSTPAFPKFLEWDSEEDYINECGWGEYIEVFNNPETLQKRPLWWCFLKNEVLKKKKIEQNDIRMILCTDPVFTRIGASFEQDQNSRMKQKTEDHAAQVGWTPFFSGLDRRIRRLYVFGEKTRFVEMDWTRYDGTIPGQLFWRIKKMRFFFLKEKYQRKYKDLYNWYIANLLEKIILLPTGEVCQVKKGNPSGQFSTTVDNNFCNVWLTTFEFGYLYYTQKGVFPSAEQIIANVKYICYGDDRLLSYNADFVDYDRDTIIKMYADVFGMWVKEENVKVQMVPEGLSFCGLTIIKQDCGKYVGIPNVDKILSTLSDPTKRLPNIEALWGKLVSLRLLCHNCESTVVDFLEKQIDAVECYAYQENIKLPEVGPNFYNRLW